MCALKHELGGKDAHAGHVDTESRLVSPSAPAEAPLRQTERHRRQPAPISRGVCEANAIAGKNKKTGEKPAADGHI